MSAAKVPYAAETQAVRRALKAYALTRYAPPAEIMEVWEHPVDLYVGEVRVKAQTERGWQARLRPDTGPLHVVTMVRTWKGFYIFKTADEPRS
jgi:hypothetical protein